MLQARDFGVVGDGRKDDTAALQRAIDAAGEIGGTVYLPAGVYLTSELVMHPSTGLVGEPTWSYRDPGGTILRLADPAARCVLNLNRAFGATLNGLSLDGAQQAGDGVHGIMVDRPEGEGQEDAFRIERCRVSHFSGDGMRLGRIWCFSVRHCQVIFCGGDGLNLRGWDGFVLDSWFSGNGGAGIAAREENASNTITANRIEWNHLGGIVIRGGNEYNITGNYIDRSGGAGLALLPRPEKNGFCSSFAVTGNVFYRSGAKNWRELGPEESTHALLDGVRGLAFTGNSFRVGRDDDGEGEWSPEYGIICRGLSHSVIKDNVLYQACTREVLSDRGGHGEGVIIADNVGCLREE